ncbi:acyl-CoA synthetase [Pseudoteredinibacter isoporae]|uniref:Fatty-acyl-CoA synthase n=1 Tax=Pseudoteredinibacter isoporae TaxID=570281 RepID=A0A7X0JSH2_9GAMM|nr:acyl-CoA synthetase [Pseudoteredinibacter isoporae]MBB6521480.1 fatty-acyl-CoA synthase [Pseudoteredinibacter isoporae]NHO87034.1 acyl-CoA synthetase [Pseudoteredinibacter isoporae]NIB24513.1 acyl-CoA synthetase [Pseudoteredinibacter isoporae]
MNTIQPFNIRNIRDIQNIESVPLSEQQLPVSSYEVFKRSAERYRDRIALRYLESIKPDIVEHSFTYPDLLGIIHQTANAFVHLGASVDKPVSMLLENVPQAHFTIWGAEAGACVNPINPLLDIEHICAVLNEARTHVLVLSSQHVAALNDIKAQVPRLKAALTVGVSEAELASLTVEGLHVDDFDRCIAEFSSAQLNVKAPVGEQRASLFHTGGTTGVPKLAPHSHFNEVVNAWQFGGSVNLTEQDVGLCVLPMFHVNAVFITGLAPFMVGAEVVLATENGYRNADVQEAFWEIIERYRASYFSTVPTIVHDLLQLPSNHYDLSSLRFAGCGAAPLSREVMRRFERKTGLRLLEGYGLTESTAVSTIHAPGIEQRVGAVGLRMPYMQIKIAQRQENGEYLDCPAGSLGSVLIKGPNVFSGYTDPKKNVDIWVHGDWLDTGDLGYLDEDEYLWLSGRSKDLIIRGGHNIDPLMIEDAFYKHDAIAVVAAVGKPDARVGELPVVYVQLKAGIDISGQELLSFAQGNISERAAIPKELHIVDKIPTTAVGKVFKPDLHRDIAAKVVAENLRSLHIQGQVTVCDDASAGFRVEVFIAENAELEAKLTRKLEEYSFAYCLINEAAPVQNRRAV